jgi:hypothetical protein
MEYTINLNQDLNGIELIFASKPATAIIEAIKKQGFRWNNKKSLWYAKQTADRLSFAESLGQGKTTESTSTKTKKETPAESINMDGVKHQPLTAHGSDLAKIIREELKNRGVKGVTVRSRRVTYDTGITITVKASAEDFASVEEFQKRKPFALFECDALRHGVFTGQKWIYSGEWETLTDEEKQIAYNNYSIYTICKEHEFSTYHRERKNFPELTTKFWDKLNKIYEISNQWNYNNSDSMTDYFDIGYYLDININSPEFSPRQEMTEEEKTAYNEEIAEKERREAEALARYEEERRQAEEEHKRYEEQRKKDTAAIYNNIKVVDLEKEKQFFCYGLVGGIGKEATLDEVNETGRTISNGALITRKVIFTNPAIFETFGKYLLNDFDFLAEMGGTASEDPRITDENYYKLTEAQRNTVEFYYNKCVGIYLNDTLKLVIDPQGYNYARYTYTADTAEIKPAIEELERMSNPDKPDFYIPAPIESQLKNINIGEEITIYMCDGWILTNIENGRGTVKNIYPSEYAQYKGYTISFSSGKSVFIRDGKEILIYKGIKTRLPESVTSDRINNNMIRILSVFDGVFDRVYKYYLEQNEKPLLDTVAK